MKIITMFMLLTLAGASPAAVDTPVANIRELLALSPVEAAESRPIRIKATVVYADAALRTWFFQQDGWSCYGTPRDGQKMEEPVLFGDTIELRGVSAPGGFKPIIIVETLRKLPEPATAPHVHKAGTGGIFTPYFDAQFVEVPTRILSIAQKGKSIAMELEASRYPLHAVFPSHFPGDSLPNHLLQRRVLVRGVAATVFNDERQMTGRVLYVPSLEQIQITESKEPDFANAELIPSNTLLGPRQDLNQPHKLKGTVLHVQPGEGIYVQDEAGSFFIRWGATESLTTGDLIEAVGLGSLEPFRPGLSAASVTKKGAGRPPLPVRLDATKPRRTTDHHTLVTLEAKIEAISQGRYETTFTCLAGGIIFDARLSTSHAAPFILPGASVSLTGICQLKSSSILNAPGWIEGFSLQLRDGDDIHVIQNPSWWNARRLTWLLFGVLTLSAAAGTWAFILRRTVQAQTLLIKEKVERAAVLEERQRIAREMHDTFQQSLAGAGHLVDDALRRLNGSNHEAKTPLQLARQMLRHCRDESRASIAELRSLTLESLGITEAFDALLRPVVENAGLHFGLTVSDDLPDIPNSHSHALLRIAQESVNNTIKHAQARSIRVSLSAPDRTLTLSVADDGCGFDPAAAQALQGHFGILGMKERAQKLGGHVEITSTPRGTEVGVTLPLDAAAFDEPLIISQA